MEKHHREIAHKRKSKNKGLLLFCVVSFLWFIFRTGTKPSRIVYPCQRAALANSSMLLSASIPLSLTAVLAKTGKFLSRKGTAQALLIVLSIAAITSEPFGRFFQQLKQLILIRKLNSHLDREMQHLFQRLIFML